MVTLSLRYPVRRGKERVFEQVLRAVIRALILDPGHVRSRLLRAEAGQLYELVTEWRDERSARSFSQSQLFMKLAQWSDQDVLERRPCHSFYDWSLNNGSPALGSRACERPDPRRVVADSRSGA